MYESQIVKRAEGFTAVILRQTNGPNLDIVKEIEVDDYETAMIWVDDELSRLKTGKGVWE